MVREETSPGDNVFSSVKKLGFGRKKYLYIYIMMELSRESEIHKVKQVNEFSQGTVSDSVL